MNANAGLSPDDRERIKAHLAECIAAIDKAAAPLEEGDLVLKRKLLELHAKVALTRSQQ